MSLLLCVITIIVCTTSVAFCDENQKLLKGEELSIFLSTATVLDEIKIDGVQGHKAYHLDDASTGQRLQLNIPVRNSLSTSIEIGDVKTSCGCVVAVPQLRKLGPNEATALLLDISFDKIGVFSRSIHVAFETGQTPILIELTGKVLSPFTLVTYSWEVAGDDKPLILSLRSRLPDSAEELRFLPDGHLIKSVSIESHSGSEYKLSVGIDRTAIETGEVSAVGKLFAVVDKDTMYPIDLNVTDLTRFSIKPVRLIGQSKDSLITVKGFLFGATRHLEKFYEGQSLGIAVAGGRTIVDSVVLKAPQATARAGSVSSALFTIQISESTKAALLEADGRLELRSLEDDLLVASAIIAF